MISVELGEERLGRDRAGTGGGEGRLRGGGVGRKAGWHAQHPRFPSGKLLRGSSAAPAPARITAETLDLT